jgi:hypothetical protein
MQNLLALALLAGLCLAIRVLSVPPSWLGSVADRVTRPRTAEDGGRPTSGDGYRYHEADPTTVESGLLAQPFIRSRLDALVEELERLDRDPDVFAKAFHLMAARSAREALLADASRLATQPRRSAGSTFDVEVLGSSTGTREELEL